MKGGGKGGALGSLFARPTPGQQQGVYNQVGGFGSLGGLPGIFSHWNQQPQPQPQPTAMGINPGAANGGAIYQNPQAQTQQNPWMYQMTDIGGWGNLRPQPSPYMQYGFPRPNTFSLQTMNGFAADGTPNRGLFG